MKPHCFTLWGHRGKTVWEVHTTLGGLKRGTFHGGTMTPCVLAMCPLALICPALILYHTESLFFTRAAPQHPQFSLGIGFGLPGAQAGEGHGRRAGLVPTCTPTE